MTTGRNDGRVLSAGDGGKRVNKLTVRRAKFRDMR
jgi:hypothetical protein